MSRRRCRARRPAQDRERSEGFAAARFSDDADGLARRDVEAHPVNGRKAAARNQKGDPQVANGKKRRDRPRHISAAKERRREGGIDPGRLQELVNGHELHVGMRDADMPWTEYDRRDALHRIEKRRVRPERDTLRSRLDSGLRRCDAQALAHQGVVRVRVERRMRDELRAGGGEVKTGDELVVLPAQLGRGTLRTPPGLDRGSRPECVGDRDRSCRCRAPRRRAACLQAPRRNAVVASFRAYPITAATLSDADPRSGCERRSAMQRVSPRSR